MTDLLDNLLQILKEFEESEFDTKKVKDLSLQDLHSIVLLMEVRHESENPTYTDVNEPVTPVFENQTEEYKKKQKKLRRLYLLFRAYAYVKSLEEDIRDNDL